MQYVTEYAKRRNTVKLSLNTKKKDGANGLQATR